ncbi:hypothetical protein F4779DRAFT_60525 [Xylariaceae sp. FL0662B]|nr:hypothetical protein F4779DRAFT_60525 [Xylariaceae sp. FL0662B]
MYTQLGLIIAACAACVSGQIAPILNIRAPLGNIKLKATTTGNSKCLSSVQSWVNSLPTPTGKLESAMSSQSANYLPSSTLADLCAIATDMPKAQAPAYTKYNNAMYAYFSTESANLVAMASNCPDEVGSDSKSFVNELNDILSVYSSFSAGACDKAATITSTSAPGTSPTASPSPSPTAYPTGSSIPSTSEVTSSVSQTSSGGNSEASTASNVTSTPLPTTSSGTSASTSAESTPSTSESPSSSTPETSTSPTVNAGPKQTGMLAAAAVAVGFVGAAVAL